MNTIIDELKKEQKGNEDFRVKNIKNYTSFFIGIDSQDKVVFLIKPRDFKTNKQPISSRGDYLDILFNKDCEIRSNGNVIKDSFVVLPLKTNENKIIDVFLDMCGYITNKLKDNPNYKEVIKIVESLRDMFSKLTQGRDIKEIGLWGELFLIYVSTNKEFLIDSWHINNSDTFDFNDGNTKLEVKTTTLGQRIHNFRLNQILKSIDSESLIVSIMTTPIERGVSVEDLINKIKKNLIPDYKIKLMKRVIDVAGDKLPEFKAKFDATTAENNYKFYKASTIPSIHQNSIIDPGVSNVNFNSNLEGIAEVSISRHKKGILSYLG